MNNEILIKNNEIVSNDILDKLEDYRNAIEEIVEDSEFIVESYFRIGSNLNYIKENKLYELEDYADIYELAEDKFKFKKTAVKNMIDVYLKYKNEYDHLLSEFRDYSYTALVELLPVSNDEILENYKSSMTVKEIRESKKISQLTDELKVHIEHFEDVIEVIKDCVNRLNEKIDKKYKITFKERIKNLDIFDFNYKYEFDHVGFDYYDLKYEKVILNVNGEIEYKRKIISNLTLNEIQDKFNLEFEKYYNYLEEKKKNESQSTDQKEKVVITERRRSILECTNLTVYQKRVLEYIKTCLLWNIDEDAEISAWFINGTEKLVGWKGYILPLKVGSEKFAEIHVSFEDDNFILLDQYEKVIFTQSFLAVNNEMVCWLQLNKLYECIINLKIDFVLAKRRNPFEVNTIKINIQEE